MSDSPTIEAQPGASPSRPKSPKKVRHNRRRTCSGTSSTCSDDSKCPICLSSIDDVATLDGCQHEFCFVCILEWTKVKLECPLCKARVQTITHKFRNGNRGEGVVLHLTPPDDFPDDSILFSSVEIAGNSSDRRRSVYMRNQWAFPFSFNGRNLNPSFFRENEAQTHRILAWLNRELVAIRSIGIRNLPLRYDPVISVTSEEMDSLGDLLRRFHLLSAEMLSHLARFVGTRLARHFLHELYVFADSRFTLAQYDRQVDYSRTSEAYRLSQVHLIGPMIPEQELNRSSRPLFGRIVSVLSALSNIRRVPPVRSTLVIDDDDDDFFILDDDDEEEVQVIEPNSNASSSSMTRRRRSPVETRVPGVQTRSRTRRPEVITIDDDEDDGILVEETGVGDVDDDDDDDDDDVIMVQTVETVDVDASGERERFFEWKRKRAASHSTGSSSSGSTRSSGGGSSSAAAASSSSLSRRKPRKERTKKTKKRGNTRV